MGFKATLNFRKFKVALNPMYRKFKVALNPMYRIFSDFAKSCIFSCLSKFDIKKKIQSAGFKL